MSDSVVIHKNAVKILLSIKDTGKITIQIHLGVMLLSETFGLCAINYSTSYL